MKKIHNLLLLLLFIAGCSKEDDIIDPIDPVDPPDPPVLCEVDYTTLQSGINRLTSHYQPMNIPFVDKAKVLNINLPAYGNFTLWSAFGNFNNNNKSDYVIVATGGQNWENLPPGEIIIMVDDYPKLIIPNPQAYTRKISIYDLNSDGIDDIVLFGHGPEFGDPWPGDRNVVIYVTETGYQIEEIGRYGFHHGGAVGVLSGNSPSILQINPQAFMTDVDGFMTMMTDKGNGWVEENTNISTHHISRTYQSELFDFNKDGVLDLILGGHEWEESWMSSSPRPVVWQNHILIGLGEGQFDVDNPIFLPQIPNWGVITDFDIYDIDGDGLEEIIVTRTTGKDGAGSTLIEGEYYDGIKIQILKGSGTNWYEWKRLESPNVTNLHFPWAHKSTIYDVNKDCLLDIVPENDKFNSSTFIPFNPIRGIYYEQQENGNFIIKYKR